MFLYFSEQTLPTIINLLARTSQRNPEVKIVKKLRLFVENLGFHLNFSALEVIGKPQDVILLLFDSKEGILRQAMYYQLHEVPDGSLVGEEGEISFEEDVLMEGGVCFQT